MRAYAAGVKAGVPVVHTGEPGQAKTATIKGCAKAWGRHTETLIGSTRESTDFLGVMIEDAGVVKYSTFQWAQNLITADNWLLFLEEFNTAAPSTMKGMLRVVHEEYVGDTKLNDTVSIVALMNPIETAMDAHDLPDPTDHVGPRPAMALPTSRAGPAGPLAPLSGGRRGGDGASTM